PDGISLRLTFVLNGYNKGTVAQRIFCTTFVGEGFRLQKYSVSHHLKVVVVDDNQEQRYRNNRNPFVPDAESAGGTSNDHQRKKDPEVPAIGVQKVCNINGVRLLASRKRHDKIHFQDFQQGQKNQTGVEQRSHKVEFSI